MVPRVRAQPPRGTGGVLAGDLQPAGPPARAERRRRIRRARPRARVVAGRLRALLPGAALLAALLLAAPAAAQELELPSRPTATLKPGAAPAPAPPAAAATHRAVPVRLAPGSRGAAVRDLQRELRRRGLRLVVDGVFGPATRRAVQRMQRRLRMRPTGVAGAPLLRRLGLRARAVAAPAPAPGASPYLKVFPVARSYTYVNDWGAPRGQGSHEGTDIMAPRHTPLIAVDSGVVSKLARTETGLGGIYVWIERADGVQYYYAHMQSIAAGLEVGSRVGVGEVIGTVGNSGDARYGATHVHFEIRREWTPTNPYPHLTAVDPRTTAAGRAGTGAPT